MRASGRRGRRGRSPRCARAGRACGARPSSRPWGRPRSSTSHRLRRQPLAALAPAAPDHVAARARAHPGAKPVGPGALALLRLLGALHRIGQSTDGASEGGAIAAPASELRGELFSAKCGVAPQAAGRPVYGRPRCLRSPKTTTWRPSGSASGTTSRPRCRRPRSSSGSSRCARSRSGVRPCSWPHQPQSAPGSSVATAAAARGRPRPCSGARGGRLRRRRANGRGRGRVRAPRSLPLDPTHTFERFVIGPGNRLAHAAALAVAESPGEAYNPLFLHGPPGLGKTHLLGAIAELPAPPSTRARASTTRPPSGSRPSSSAPCAARGPSASRQRYRELDALLIDDVQVLEGKRAHRGGVRPHLQRPVRGRQADRALQRPPAGGARAARRAPPRPLRLGPARRARGARPAHPDRAPLAPRRRRRRPSCPTRRALQEIAAQRARQRPAARGRDDPRARPRLAAQRAARSSPLVRRALRAGAEPTRRRPPEPPTRRARSRRPSAPSSASPARSSFAAAHRPGRPGAAARDVPRPRAHPSRSPRSPASSTATTPPSSTRSAASRAGSSRARRPRSLSTGSVQPWGTRPPAERRPSTEPRH